VLCEDAGIPYIFVPSKEELGAAGLTKRPTSCMLLLPKPAKGELATDAEGKEFAEAFEEVRARVVAAQVVF
jgi:H/ACA ribonucleoprotein complex subunit 2